MVWIAVVVATFLLGAIGSLLWVGAKERVSVSKELQVLHALPTAEARALALRLLGKSDLFDCKRADGQAPALAGLPQSVIELFEMFEEVRSDEFWVGWAALKESSTLPGYTKIGEDFEFEEILVCAGSTEIHMYYGENQGAASRIDSTPSVWHRIITASGTRVLGA